MLAANNASPWYVAVIECAPTDSAAQAEVGPQLSVVQSSVSVPVPITVVPSLKVTVPVGVAEDGFEDVTVAVKVTVSPHMEGVPEVVNAVVVAVG